MLLIGAETLSVSLPQVPHAWPGAGPQTGPSTCVLSEWQLQAGLRGPMQPRGATALPGKSSALVGLTDGAEPRAEALLLLV